MSLHDEIRLLALELGEGEGAYTDCPSCGRKGKFSILMSDDGVIYHCFRASCSLHDGGKLSTKGSARLVRTRQPRRKQKFTPFTGELCYLDDEWKEYLRTKIGFASYHLSASGVMFAPEEHRVAFPIYNPMGRRRGWSLRSYSAGVTAKVLTRMDNDEPHLSWYMTRPEEGGVLVVEDIPSAVRASAYTNAVALCGTGCNYDYASEIAAHTRAVTWALDADATAEAILLHRKYSLMFTASGVLTLPKDLKDFEESELKEFLDA